MPAFVALENQLITRGAMKLSSISEADREEKQIVEQQKARDLWSMFSTHFASFMRSQYVNGAWKFWNQVAVQFLVQHCSADGEQKRAPRQYRGVVLRS